MSGSQLQTLTPYFLVGGALLLLAGLRSWRLHDKNIDKLLALILIVSAAIVAGSVDLGTDSASYHNYYLELLAFPIHYGWWDPGFEYLAILFATVGAPYGLFVFANVLTSHLIKLHVYDDIVSNKLLALFVLFCFNLGEIAFVRQYLAASIALLSFYLLTRRRIFWAVLAMISATLIHKSALPISVVIILIYFGRSSLKPLALLAAIVAAATLVLPPNVIQALIARVFTQAAAYTAQGYVQGLGTEDISLVRNVSKFAVYAALALWMATLTPTTARETVQRQAAYIVLAVSALGILLTVSISPVFSRLSVYVFPFLALSIRRERFVPSYSQLPFQCAAVAMLATNLVISTYPLAEYL